MFIMGNLQSEISANITILIVAALVLAGMTLILVLVLGGRIRPGLIHEFNRKKRRTPVKNQNNIPSDTFDPQVTTSGWKNRLHRTERRSSTKSYAYLIPLEEQLFDFSVRLIALANKEVTIGSDPEQADIVINHASIDPCHARIRHNINGLVELYDLKSVAGCWLNYIPIGDEGGTLHEGDYVHIGGIGFRFTLKQARRLPKPTIHLLPPKNHLY
jgi:FHA domain